jgi:hypothetical protein
MDEDFQPVGEGALPPSSGIPGHTDEQIEALTLIVAHLAAQLTMSQIRLRALATALERHGVVDPAEVQGFVTQIADHETGFYLRENLGETLSNLIEVDDLAREIMEYLGNPGSQSS